VEKENVNPPPTGTPVHNFANRGEDIRSWLSQQSTKGLTRWSCPMIGRVCNLPHSSGRDVRTPLGI
jgi:hypothetical protein